MDHKADEMTDFCIDLVSPHSNGASLIYTVVGLLLNSICDLASCIPYCVRRGPVHPENSRLSLQVYGLPDLLFLLFLGWRFMPSMRKLKHQESHIMTTYYVFLWVVGLLNLLRCFALLAEAQQSSPFLLNVLWLMTRYGKPHSIQKVMTMLVNITAAYCNGHSRPFRPQRPLFLQMSRAFAMAVQGW